MFEGVVDSVHEQGAVGQLSQRIPLGILLQQAFLLFAMFELFLQAQIVALQLPQPGHLLGGRVIGAFGHLLFQLPQFI